MTAPPTAPTTPSEPESPRQSTESQTARMRAALEKIRSRNDATAKTFGALATTALTAVALSKISDLFPLPPSHRALFWAAVAVLGFVAMAAAVTLLVSRLWSLSAPLYTTSDLSTMEAEYPIKEEYRLLKGVYDETARLNRREIARAEDENAREVSLENYEQRGHELEDKAQRRGTTDEQRQRLYERAATIRADVAEAQARAAVLVARRRSANAATGGITRLTAVLFIAGLIGFGAGTDWLAAERDDAKIALGKSCGDAQKAIADAKATGVTILPGFCGSLKPSPVDASSSPHAIQEKATSIAALAQQWKDCVARAKQPPDLEACRATLQLALQVGAGPP